MNHQDPRDLRLDALGFVRDAELDDEARLGLEPRLALAAPGARRREAALGLARRPEARVLEERRRLRDGSSQGG